LDREEPRIKRGRWALSKNLEEEFQSELAQRRRRSQSKQERLRSLWVQWKLFLGFLLASGILFGAASIIGYTVLNPSGRPKAQVSPKPSSPKPSLTPVETPLTGVVTTYGEVAPENSGGIKIYVRPPEEGDRSKLGKDCPPVVSGQTMADRKNHHFIKILDWETQKTVQTLFVRSGGTVTAYLPVGAYKLRFASGEIWYGEQHYFGDGTFYGEMADKINPAEPVKFAIAQPGNFWDVGFYSCLTGNSRNKPLSAEEF
jgi:hypothetical protein